jgi:hypothetical protein
MSTQMSEEGEGSRPALDDRVVSAIDLVVGAFGEVDAWFAVTAGGLEGRPDALHRLARRAGSPVVDRITRDGDLARLDYDDSVALARALARRHAAEIEAHLRAEEHRTASGWSAPEGIGSGTSAHQLVRSWVSGAA